MKAAALVQWIKRRTSLTCFNFEFGFAELRKEVEEKFPARGVPIRGQVRAMAAQPVLSAEEVASATYMLQFESGREHECQAQARCQYTLGEAVEDRVYVRLGA